MVLLLESKIWERDQETTSRFEGLQCFLKELGKVWCAYNPVNHTMPVSTTLSDKNAVTTFL